MCRCMKPGVKNFVLDCEVVAYDREKNRILPFQVGFKLFFGFSSGCTYAEEISIYLSIYFAATPNYILDEVRFFM